MTIFDHTSQFVLAFDTEYGFDPRDLFCQITGKRIARVDDDEFDTLIESLGDADLDSKIDDVAIRLFASMRPSMRWNKMRAESLDDMRKQVPAETMCYLLNRLFAQRDNPHHYTLMHDRIRLYERVADWYDCALDDSEPTQLQMRIPRRSWLDTVMHLLLEVDAKLALQTESAPFTARDFLDNFTSFDSLMEMIQAWHAKAMKRYAAFTKQQEMETRWWRSGNALAKPAFFSSFMEHKPPTQAQQKVAAKKEESDFFSNVLNEIMGKPTLDGKETAPKPVFEKVTLPSTKMPGAWAKKVKGPAA